jgi:hypothetical protein
MRFQLWLAVVLLALGMAAEPSPLRLLVESIPATVPAEFAADLLIRVADSPAASKESVDWRADVYEQAFQLAAGAQEPLPTSPRSSVQAGLRPDAQYGVNGLDGLSLRVRALNALLELRRDQALALAATIDVRVPPLTCRDQLVASPIGAFDVARHGFSALERQVLAVRSSTQVAPALGAIESATVSESQSRDLVIALAGILRTLDDDDVNFTESLAGTWAAVKRAVDGAEHDPVAASLLDAFRSYLVLHLSGERCAPIGLTRNVARTGEDHVLNEVDEVLSGAGRPRLTLKERTAARIVESPLPPALWQSPASRALLAKANALRFHQQAGRPVYDRRPPEWDEQLSQFYSAMAAWVPGAEPSTAQYLQQRGILLELLADVIPSGPDRIRALGDLLAFLKSDARQLLSNQQWFVRFRALMDKCRNAPAEWEWMLRSLLDSGDPVMRLYAQMEQLPGER